ncbi:hypothetical protein GC088_10875 [Arthrobacter sp. JZ12]|uniref:hypothetical protein n=1 Tax=Arthrobacter sp. JZ12 TaxID=2654190 RepID=UPI002B4799A2|nr:hypothetical protein [Arthrobacter sp. JZ12]WRH25518.1 hypothetical protein GC088_10875 [Arthrobacter sp. JZ12]
MTTLTSLSLASRPSGFDALLIQLGRWLVRYGERLAARQQTVVSHTRHEDRLRDGIAMRHSGIWP